MDCRVSEWKKEKIDEETKVRKIKELKIHWGANCRLEG